MNPNPLHAAIFLDRDGVLIENRPAHVRTWDDVVFYEQALDALADLAARPVRIILVTNQSVIGRGLAPEAEIRSISDRITASIRARGGRIDAVYLCPHAPEDDCPCRKPRPGMILHAAADHGIDLSRSIMIGDAITDLEAARAAGIPRYALVQTGRGLEQEKLLRVKSIGEAGAFADLKTALEFLLKSDI